MSISLEDTVMMCHTFENTYWCKGHVNKTKFKGRLLSGFLEGDEEPSDILAGKVKHGWVISVAGDWSGCGGDYTIYFLDEKPEGKTYEEHADYFDSWDEKDVREYLETNDIPGTIIDGPHEATWWSP